MSYTISQSKQIDYDLLENIWKINFPKLDASKRLKWTYFDFFIKKPVVYYIKDDKTDKIVGSGSVFYREYFYKGKIFKVGVTGDFSILPKHRLLAPAISLQKEIIKNISINGFDFLLAFPNKNSCLVQKQAGYKNYGEIVRCVQILKTKNKLEKKSNVIFSTILSKILDVLLNGYYSVLALNVKGGTDYFIDDHLYEFDNSFDNLFNHVKDNFDFINNISSKYLNWRFIENPLQEYKYFILKDRKKKNPIAFVVYSIDENNILVDLFIWDKKQISLERLFIEFKKYFKKTQYETISIVLNEKSFIVNRLKKIGFLKKGEGNKILVYNPSSGFEKEIMNITRSVIFNSDNDL